MGSLQAGTLEARLAELCLPGLWLRNEKAGQWMKGG